MAINRVTYRSGKERIEVRKRWPDGREFRRFYSNMRSAKHMLARIEGSIVDGSWQDLRREVSGQQDRKQLTVEDFSETFMEKYAKPRLRSWNRYELSFKSLNEKLGTIPLHQFRRKHLHEFVKKRIDEVSAGTVNKDIATIKKMFSFALEMGVIDVHPLVRFPILKVQEVSRPVMTVEEFHRLVKSMDRLDVSVMVAVMGETGIRKGEALLLKWENVHRQEKMLTIEGRTKSGKVRHIPLSDFALSWLNRLVRYVHCPYLFVNPRTNKRRGNPEKNFERGAKKAELEWVRFHDLRRFRATHWLRMGVDVRTVKELLGHQDVKTTMRYAFLVPDFAIRSVRDTQANEARELAEELERVKNG